MPSTSNHLLLLIILAVSTILPSRFVSAQYRTPIGGFYGVVYEKDLPYVVPETPLSERLQNIQIFLADKSEKVLGGSLYYTQIYFVSVDREYDEIYGYYYRLCWYWTNTYTYTYTSKDKILAKSSEEFKFLYMYWCPVEEPSSTSVICQDCTEYSRSCSSSSSTYWRCFCGNFYRGNYVTNPSSYSTNWGPYTPAPPCPPNTTCATPTPWSDGGDGDNGDGDNGAVNGQGGNGGSLSTHTLQYVYVVIVVIGIGGCMVVSGCARQRRQQQRRNGLQQQQQSNNTTFQQQNGAPLMAEQCDYNLNSSGQTPGPSTTEMSLVGTGYPNQAPHQVQQYHQPQQPQYGNPWGSQHQHQQQAVSPPYAGQAPHPPAPGSPQFPTGVPPPTYSQAALGN